MGLGLLIVLTVLLAGCLESQLEEQRTFCSTILGMHGSKVSEIITKEVCAQKAQAVIQSIPNYQELLNTPEFKPYANLLSGNSVLSVSCEYKLIPPPNLFGIWYFAGNQYTREIRVKDIYEVEQCGNEQQCRSATCTTLSASDACTAAGRTWCPYTDSCVDNSSQCINPNLDWETKRRELCRQLSHNYSNRRNHSFCAQDFKNRFGDYFSYLTNEERVLIDGAVNFDSAVSFDCWSNSSILDLAVTKSCRDETVNGVGSVCQNLYGVAVCMTPPIQCGAALEETGSPDYSQCEGNKVMAITCNQENGVWTTTSTPVEECASGTTCTNQGPFKAVCTETCMTSLVTGANAVPRVFNVWDWDQSKMPLNKFNATNENGSYADAEQFWINITERIHEYIANKDLYAGDDLKKRRLLEPVLLLKADQLEAAKPAFVDYVKNVAFMDSPSWVKEPVGLGELSYIDLVEKTTLSVPEITAPAAYRVQISPIIAADSAAYSGFSISFETVPAYTRPPSPFEWIPFDPHLYTKPEFAGKFGAQFVPQGEDSPVMLFPIKDTVLTTSDLKGKKKIQFTNKSGNYYALNSDEQLRGILLVMNSDSMIFAGATPNLVVTQANEREPRNNVNFWTRYYLSENDTPYFDPPNAILRQFATDQPTCYRDNNMYMPAPIGIIASQSAVGTCAGKKTYTVRSNYADSITYAYTILYAPTDPAQHIIFSECGTDTASSHFATSDGVQPQSFELKAGEFSSVDQILKGIEDKKICIQNTSTNSATNETRYYYNFENSALEAEEIAKNFNETNLLACGDPIYPPYCLATNLDLSQFRGLPGASLNSRDYGPAQQTFVVGKLLDGSKNKELAISLWAFRNAQLFDGPIRDTRNNQIAMIQTTVNYLTNQSQNGFNPALALQLLQNTRIYSNNTSYHYLTDADLEPCISGSVTEMACLSKLRENAENLPSYPYSIAPGTFWTQQIIPFLIEGNPNGLLGLKLSQSPHNIPVEWQEELIQFLAVQDPKVGQDVMWQFCGQKVPSPHLIP